MALWDAATGEQLRVLRGHTDWVNGVCAVTVDGRTMLASAGVDKTVRLWDPATGRPEGTIPIHHPATSCAPADGGLAIGSTAGVLVAQFQGIQDPTG